MKSKNIKSTLFGFVIFLSMASFAYLNTLNTTNSNTPEALQMEQIDMQTQTVLPDVKLVEKAIDLVKEMLPTNE